jgi:outer membrane protein assembly factor BamB
MRYNDVEPREHVACYDAQTGMLRWRRMVCAAESPARGQAEEISNNLLTLDHGTLYLNTNLGAVAAIAAADGQIRWLSLYPRAQMDVGGIDRSANFYRDLNPCVLYRGSVLAAPTDCPAILSLDSATGQLLWASTIPRDVVHLLGVGGGNLLASGQRLWWLNADGGKVLYRWPDQATVHGYGRGALAGDNVYFPTRAEIHVFRQSLGDSGTNSPGGASAEFGMETRDPVRLDTRDPPLSGGNLVIAGGYLLIATPNNLIAFGPHHNVTPSDNHQLTQATRHQKPLAQP